MSWIVWNPKGPSNPGVEFASEGHARMVARKMAVKFPTQSFHVMELKSTHRFLVNEGSLQGWDSYHSGNETTYWRWPHNLFTKLIKGVHYTLGQLVDLGFVPKKGEKIG